MIINVWPKAVITKSTFGRLCLSRFGRVTIYNKGDAKTKLEKMEEAQENESDSKMFYRHMLLPGGSQFHPQ